LPKFTPRFNYNIIYHFLHINVIQIFQKKILTDLCNEIELSVMKIKLSATFEGKCSICNKESNRVFTAGDEDTHKVVTVCKECAERLGTEATSQVIEEYGKKDDEAFEEGIRVEGKKKLAG
jgi:hypothetical protein